MENDLYMKVQTEEEYAMKTRRRICRKASRSNYTTVRPGCVINGDSDMLYL
jgi:hypothetical protein